MAVAQCPLALPRFGFFYLYVMRLHLVLIAPAIAGNIGCAFRSATCFGARLHIVASPLSSSLAAAAAAGPRSVIGDNAAAAVRRGAAGRVMSGSNTVLYFDYSDFALRLLPRLDAVVTLSTRAPPLSEAELRSTLSRAGAAAAAAGRVAEVAALCGAESSGITSLPQAAQDWLLEPPALADQSAIPRYAFRIPIEPGTRSLNLAVCAGIALHELRRALPP